MYPMRQIDKIIMSDLIRTEPIYTDTLVDLYPDMLKSHTHNYEFFSYNEPDGNIRITGNCLSCGKKYHKTVTQREILGLY
jgi:hypothetical protein